MQCPFGCEEWSPKLMSGAIEHNVTGHMAVCPKRPSDWERRSGHASNGLDAKLAIFDAHSDGAITALIDWLIDHADDLIALARGRHVEGHYRYGDSNFLEWSDGELRAQTAQELADAIVYESRALYRSNNA